MRRYWVWDVELLHKGMKITSTSLSSQLPTSTRSNRPHSLATTCKGTSATTSTRTPSTFSSKTSMFAGLVRRPHRRRQLAHRAHARRRRPQRQIVPRRLHSMYPKVTSADPVLCRHTGSIAKATRSRTLSTLSRTRTASSASIASHRARSFTPSSPRVAKASSFSAATLSSRASTRALNYATPSAKAPL